jgi:hypothetical protein
MPATAHQPSKATTRAEQGEFDFLIPWGPLKKLATTAEVARVIGRQVDFVRALVESGRLESHADSATGEQLSNRITTRSVRVLMAETAQYESADLLPRLEAVVRDLGPAGWDALEQFIARCRRAHAKR